jgi:hypothetical protein
VEINKIEIAGGKWRHRESVRIFGMNQARIQRTSVKLTTAIKAPKAIDIAHDGFSAGQELLPNHAAGLRSRITRRPIHSASVQSDY